MKKAFLVEFSVRTRVVLDIPDNVNEDNLYDYLDEKGADIAIEKAQNNILQNPIGYLSNDNIISIEEDLECPYDKEYDN